MNDSEDSHDAANDPVTDEVWETAKRHTAVLGVQGAPSPGVLTSEGECGLSLSHEPES